MARLGHFAFLCIAVCCTSALAARELRQVSTGGATAPSQTLNILTSAVPPATFVQLATAPAPGPGMLAPEIAPIGGGIDSAPAPAAAPVGGPGSCYVDWSADVQEQSAGSSTSYNGPACTIVTPGLSNSACQAQAASSGRTYVPTADPACLYPVSNTCSSLQSTFPSATPCPTDTANSVKSAAEQGKFNSAVAANMASAPPIFGSSIFGNSPSTGSSNFFGNTGGLTFPSFPGFPGTG